MARRGPEAKIQDAVIKYARSKGLLCKKNEVGRYFVSSGWPDVVFFAKGGLTFFHEYKRMGGKLTPLQEYQCKELRQLDFAVETIDSVEKGKASIDEHCKDPTDSRQSRFGGRRR